MSQGCGFEVKDSEEFGRLIIAKKDFRYGELILDEEPLLIAQFGKQDVSSSSHNKSEDMNKVDVFCVGCFKILSLEKLMFCNNCNFPVCCNNCESESLHARYECSLFKEKMIAESAISTKGLQLIYQHLYLVRGVLMYLDDNTTAWDKLASLSTSSYKNHREIYRANYILKERLGIDVGEKIVGQIMGAFKVNSFDMSGEDQYGNMYKTQAVYHFGSMFSHGCSPNAIWVIHRSDWKGTKKGNLRVYARRKILRGEQICISYIAFCFALPTAERKSQILNQFKFECKCSRCLDPSELSLYTEAVKCPACGDETLTADNSSDSSSTWTCNHCKISQDHSVNEMLLENFDPSFIWDCSAEDLSHGQCGLSTNHREIITTTYLWIEERCLTGFKELRQHSTVSEQMFVKLMTAATKCLKVLKWFSSMTNIVELEYWFARIIAAYYFKTLDFLSTPYDHYLPEEKVTIITAICAHLNTSYDTMQWFPFDFMPLVFSEDLVDAHKFWNKKLSALEDACSVGLSDPSEEITEGVRRVKVIDKVTQVQSSPKDFKENFNEVTSSEPQTSASELRDRVTKHPHVESELLTEAVEMEKVVVGQSSDLLAPDVVTPSKDSNLSLKKPLVSLLTELDFYFNA